MTGDDDAKRAENEATFRDANEQIRKAEQQLQPPLDRVPYICECDDVRCREQIRLTSEEYEGIRRNPAFFAIVPGHSSQGDVVEEHSHFHLVRKTGIAAEVTRARDTRTAGT